MARKTLKIAMGGLILLAAGIAIVLSMSSFVNPYVTVTELIQDPHAYQDDNIQLVGVVAKTSITYSDSTTQFVLQDIDNIGDEIVVKFYDVPPNGLHDDQKIVAIGHVINVGEFEAQKLLMQCPSKYQ